MCVAGVVAALNGAGSLMLPSMFRAATLAPGPCVWTSKVSPDAVIRLQASSDPVPRQAELFYRQTRISRFDVSTSQNYCTSW